MNGNSWKVEEYRYLSLAEVSPIKKRVRLIVHVVNYEDENLCFFERMEGRERESVSGREGKGK